MQTKDKESPPGTIVGNGNVKGGQMVASAQSTKITGNLVPLLFPELLLKWQHMSDEWINEPKN